ncbi:hypothetical protein [Amaricoccus solimangrovi]|uniref:Uncharacterized protein n=1 Tax=Amaricoccus solimangrovi TaxID=2589815 RepID=A0A501WNM6_9RHOB|nr:hypothetical protein [Amaricoccus solimangrovi]TPE49945.1 hypothetical protein FJM51_13400 [Amaricoccus solimangrovi]
MNNSLVVGAGALLVGIIIGYSMSGGEDETAREALARTEALSTQVEAMSGKVDGLDQKLGGVEAAVVAFNATQNEALTALSGQIQGIGQTVSGAVDKLGAGIGETMKSQMDGMRSALSSMRGMGGTGGETGGESGGDSGPAGGQAAPAGTGTALRPGMTAVISPDKLHVFLSSADSAAGSAMVAVNGQSLQTLKVGEEQEANGCHFSLTGFDADGAAMIDGGC